MTPRIVASFLVAFVSSAAAMSAADFTGRWEGWPTLPDGMTFRVSFVFTATTDGHLKGAVETDEFGNFDVTDITVDGEKITFKVPTDDGIFHHIGALRPDGLLVEGTGPQGAIAPVLYKRPAADLAGTWRGQVETPDGPLEVVYTFVAREGQFSGTAKTPMGEAPLTNIVVDGPRVSFESDYAGFSIKRRGTVSGDVMNLTIAIGGNEISATFKRDPAPPAPAPGKAG